jgi:ABC-2 type transport system ATP-binding protein
VKDRTTILFSTHILSDVERICTDVAFLDQGMVKLQGKLSQLRSSREYLLELRQPQDMALLTGRFPGLREEDGKLRFRELETAQHEILAFLAENRIGVAQLQQAEQSLESLFLEVAE